MKRILPFLGLLILVASCDVYVEPAYDPRDKIVGRYDVEEYSQTYHDYIHYAFYIKKSGHSRRYVWIDNFYGANVQVEAYLDYNNIVIPYQVVNDLAIEGSGTVYGSEIQLNYSVRDLYHNSYTDFCETTAWFER